MISDGLFVAWLLVYLGTLRPLFSVVRATPPAVIFYPTQSPVIVGFLFSGNMLKQFPPPLLFYPSPGEVPQPPVELVAFWGRFRFPEPGPSIKFYIPKGVPFFLTHSFSPPVLSFSSSQKRPVTQPPQPSIRSQFRERSPACVISISK